MPARRSVGTAAHMPRSSWRRNSATRRSSSSASSGSPSASRTSPCPGFIRTSFTAAIMPAARSRPASGAGEPEDVDRPGAARRSRAGRCRPPRRRSRAPSGRPRRAPRRGRGTRRAPTSGCSPSRARRRPGSAARRSAASRRVDQHVGAVVGVAAGDDDRLRPERRASPRRAPRRGAGSPSPESARASGRFGVSDGRARQHPLDQRRLRVRVEQRRAALGDHHRVDDDRRRADQVERLDHRVDRRLVGEHADLDRVDADVVGDRSTWATIISGATGSDQLDPDRVLGRERRDRGRPVDAAARERLQVGLDPGAAAGVRAGDREAGRDASAVWHHSI